MPALKAIVVLGWASAAAVLLPPPVSAFDAETAAAPARTTTSCADGPSCVTAPAINGDFLSPVGGRGLGKRGGPISDLRDSLGGAGVSEDTPEELVPAVDEEGSGALGPGIGTDDDEDDEDEDESDEDADVEEEDRLSVPPVGASSAVD